MTVETALRRISKIIKDESYQHGTIVLESMRRIKLEIDMIRAELSAEKRKHTCHKCWWMTVHDNSVPICSHPDRGFSVKRSCNEWRKK